MCHRSCQLAGRLARFDSRIAAQVNGEIVAKTNRALRAHYDHIVKASRADRVMLAVEDLGLFTMPKLESSAAMVAFATVYTCLLDDVIAIEDIAGQSLPMDLGW